LKVEGKAVEKVILLPKGTPRPFDAKKQIILQHPGASVSLPAGEYTLYGIELTGGFRCDNPGSVVDPKRGGLSKTEGIVIDPDKLYSLKLGAPLKQSLRADRDGRLVHIVYLLIDAAGRTYSRERSYKPPQFTVCCGGREVGSGSFEYG
jgi:hypothetical protein